MQHAIPFMLAVISLGKEVMLWAALAALVPLVIHFWNRQRFEVVPWAAMQYLAAAIRRQTRRLRLEQWLLLVVRSMILLMLALALADPVISHLPGLGAGPEGRQPRHFVLVIDGSYSMLAGKGENSSFQSAIGQAEQWIDGAHQGDGFTVVMIGNPPRVVIDQPAFDRADVRGEIQSLRPTHAVAELTSTLVEVEQLVARVRQDHPEFGDVMVGIFSDLEQRSWETVLSETGRQLIDRLDQDVSLVLFDVGQAAIRNVAVLELQPLQPAIRTGLTARWEAVIENFSDQTVDSLEADWIVDGQVIHEQKLSMAPRQTRSLQLEYTFTAPGSHHVELVLEGDDLDVDNHRWHVSQVRETIQVLCVEGRPGEAELLALALDPSGQGASSVSSRRITIGSLMEESLERYQLVCLANVARFSRDEAGLLARYVSEGGCLAIFLGDQVQPENYNQLLEPLLPGSLSTVAPLGPYTLDPLGYQHPLVNIFRGQQRAGLLSTPVNSYHKIRLPEGELARPVRIAIGLENGDPLVLDHPAGEGRVLLCTTAISPLSRLQGSEQLVAWSELGSWPSFLPLVQEMVVLAMHREQLQHNLEVGGLVRGRVPEGVSHGDVQIVTPQGAAERLAIQELTGGLRWAFDRTSWSGLYEVRYEGPSPGTDMFAVNLDPRESAMLKIPSGQLPLSLQRGMVRVEDPQRPATGGPPLPLFQWLLAALVLLLLFETWLGYRPGRSSP
ncbi:MAG: BatA domain-containing protein [Pirellulaceae bacterium]